MITDFFKIEEIVCLHVFYNLIMSIFLHNHARNREWLNENGWRLASGTVSFGNPDYGSQSVLPGLGRESQGVQAHFGVPGNTRPLLEWAADRLADHRSVVGRGDDPAGGIRL